MALQRLRTCHVLLAAQHPLSSHRRMADVRIVGAYRFYHHLSDDIQILWKYITLMTPVVMSRSCTI